MSKRAGSARERKVAEWLRDGGFHVTKSGGSLGAADLVALKLGETPMLVQVKATKKGPFEHFGPDEREELCRVAIETGADPWLCWWPPHGEMRWLSPSEWPQAKVAA